MEGVTATGLKGRDKDAGDTGQDQVVKGQKWLHGWLMCKDSGQSEVSLIWVNKIKFLPVCL